MALFYAASINDKYASHNGVMIDVLFAPVDTFEVGLSVGFIHGAATKIVTGQAGLLSNVSAACLRGTATCDDLELNLPDQRRVTGVVDAVALWAPLRMNANGSLPMAVDLYVLAGLGINGTRRMQAEV